MVFPMWRLFLLGYLIPDALGGWGGEEDDDTWQPSSSSSSSQAPLVPRPGPSPVDVMTHMAIAWDEEVCLCLQEEEIAQATRGDLCGPEPEILPWPFSNKSFAGKGVNSSCWSSSSTSLDVEPPDWLAGLQDHRVLRRGQGRMSSSTSSPNPATTCPSPMTSTIAAPLCARDPSSLTSPSLAKPSILRKGKWGGDPDIQPAETDASGSGRLARVQSAQPTHEDPETPTVTTQETIEPRVEAGCTRRFGQWRPGRDRWHNADGSLINRGRPSHTVAPPTQQQPATQLATIDEESNYFRMNGSRNGEGELGVDITAVNVVHACIRTRDSAGHTNSTTAGDEPSGGDSSTSSASSDVSATAIGFWRHGIWHPRPRDAQEARSHAGGRGPQRMERKNKRMQAWLQGTWKPAWLQQYIQDKAMRQAKEVTVDMAENPATSVEEQVTENYAEAREHWTQDPQSGWWSCSSTVSSPVSATCPWDGITSWSSQVENPVDTEDDSVLWNGWENWHDWGEISCSSSTWTLKEGEMDQGSSLTDKATRSSTSSTTSATTCSTCTTTSSVCTTTSSTITCPTCTDAIAWAQEAWEAFEMIPTTSSSTSPILPNAGLYPEVRDVGSPNDEMMLMQLTGSERQRLQEAGVPQAMIQRLENLFEAMDNHQDAGRGPESRWALQRFAQRVNEGLDALDTLMGVVGRRLVPRGLWPIERLPATEGLRWNLFQWARSAAAIFQQTLEWHLATPLQPTETQAAATYSSLNAAEGGGSAGEEEIAQPRSRSRSRSPRGCSVEESHEGESEHTRDDGLTWSASSSSNGLMVAPANITYDSLPSGVQLALDGHLLGIWSEPSSGSAAGATNAVASTFSRSSMDNSEVVDAPAPLVPPPVVGPEMPVPLPVLPVQPVRLGVVPRARAGASGGGAEGDGDGAGDGEP
eukprot:s1494_g1.t1